MPANQTLIEKVISAFPELAENQVPFITKEIILQNDLDETGDYIAKWEYEKPLPTSLTGYLRA